jgi:hypothetical protein
MTLGAGSSGSTSDARGRTLPSVERSSGTARYQKHLGIFVPIVFRLYRAPTDDRPATDKVAPPETMLPTISPICPAHPPAPGMKHLIETDGFIPLSHDR